MLQQKSYNYNYERYLLNFKRESIFLGLHEFSKWFNGSTVRKLSILSPCSIPFWRKELWLTWYSFSAALMRFTNSFAVWLSLCPNKYAIIKQILIKHKKRKRNIINRMNTQGLTVTVSDSCTSLWLTSCTFPSS